MESTKDLLAPALRQYQHNDSSGFIFGYDKTEVTEIVDDLRTQLAKANERAERCEKIFSEAPDLTFDEVQRMFSDELNKFAIEKRIEGAYAVISLLDETKDSKAILMANKYVREQLRKEQE